MRGAAEEIFVTKFNTNGDGIVYSTFLGGHNQDRGYKITVDNVGMSHVTGITFSNDFPTVQAYQGTNSGGFGDIFVSKVNSLGKSLDYSTFLGGTMTDKARDIAIDIYDSVYITGFTYSEEYPTVNPFIGALGGGSGGLDAFVSKLADSSPPTFPPTATPTVTPTPTMTVTPTTTPTPVPLGQNKTHMILVFLLMVILIYGIRLR